MDAIIYAIFYLQLIVFNYGGIDFCIDFCNTRAHSYLSQIYKIYFLFITLVNTRAYLVDELTYSVWSY